MSIDRELGYREAAYMGNPEALQKRAGITKELVDAMAAQKLFNEKQSAARQMQASMAQNPATVTEQLNEGLMNLTRQEVGSEINNRAQQIMGSMQQQQAKQQKALQQLAAMAAKGGLGALTRGAQPQRPAQRAPMMSGVAGIPAPNMRMAQGGVVGYASGDLIATGPLAGAPEVDGDTNISDDPLVSQYRGEYTDALTAAKGAYGTPKQERTSAQTEAAAFLGREAKRQAAIQRQLAQIKARQQSEEELARERRRALLLGMAGKTRGFTGAGASAAYGDVLDRQRSRGIADLTAVQNLAREAEARDIEMGKDALTSGRTAEEQAAQGLRTRLDTAGGLSQTAMNTASAAANRRVEAAVANQETWVEGAKAAYESMRDTLDDVDADLNDLIAERDNVRAQVRAREEFLLSGPEHDNNVRALQSGESIVVDGIIMNSPADYAAYIQRLATEMILNGPAKEAYSKVLKRIEELQAERAELRNVTAVTPSASGI